MTASSRPGFGATGVIRRDILPYNTGIGLLNFS